MLNQNYTVEYFDGRIKTVCNMEQFIEDNYKSMAQFGTCFDKKHISYLNWNALSNYQHKIFKPECGVYIVSDCLGIIYTGTGKIVKPADLISAYIKRYGEQSLLKRKKRQNTNPKAVYGSRGYKNTKKMVQEWLYNPVDENEPAIRHSDNMRHVYNVVWSFDCRDRSIERGWKGQTKNRKQWMKK